MTREDQSVSWFKGTRGLLTLFFFFFLLTLLLGLMQLVTLVEANTH